MNTKPTPCHCKAYSFPHRPGGGLCCSPDPPTDRWQGEVGKNQPKELRRRGARRTLCREHGLHPIRDRKKIKRVLPRLYREYCERFYGAE
jgi:hypothetical protein